MCVQCVWSDMWTSNQPLQPSLLAFWMTRIIIPVREGLPKRERERERERGRGRGRGREREGERVSNCVEISRHCIRYARDDLGTLRL